MMRAAKIIFLLTAIIFFILIFLLMRCFVLYKRAYYISRVTRIFSKILVYLMGIKIDICGNRKLAHPNGIFFVTSHVSYLDGIITSSIFPLVFIARGDLKNWPLFGFFSWISDTIFINRFDPSGLHKEIGKIAEVLGSGTNVILFPEGTTSAGNTIFPFKSSFFEAPCTSRSLIVPFIINYKKINNILIDEKNRDLIFWYGDMEFLPHLIGVLSLKNIEVQFNVLQPIEICAGQDRKQLSILAKKAIDDNIVRV